MDYSPVACIKANQKTLYIKSAAWTEVLAGTSKMDSRKWVQIFNRSPYKIFYSYDSTSNVQGSFAIKAGGILILPLGESVPVYIRGIQSAESNAQKVIIAEVG
jgi:hypothetical protein